MKRRGVLKAIGGGALALGSGKAADNVLLGYGVLLGTNLQKQDLATLAGAHLAPSPFETRVDGYHVGYADGAAWVTDGDRRLETLRLAETTPGEAADVDAEYGFSGGPLEQLARDVPAVESDEVTFEFAGYESFFERLRAADARPFTVGALRGSRYHGADPETVQSFADASPDDPEAVIEGLATAFREHSSYDIPRYAAGSVQDNVIFGAHDLRQYFESPTSFDALESGANSGLFCYEFTYRSIEALHAVAPDRQAVPVFGGVVIDTRHKHVYTAVGSAIREGDDLVVPVTFVDYTHSTLYDDLHVRWALGEGVNAYDARHRTDGIFWNQYAIF